MVAANNGRGGAILCESLCVPLGHPKNASSTDNQSMYMSKAANINTKSLEFISCWCLMTLVMIALYRLESNVQALSKTDTSLDSLLTITASLLADNSEKAK